MKTLTLSCLLALGACASSQNSAPPAASVQSEASAGADTATHDSAKVAHETAAVSSKGTSDDHAEPSDNAAPVVADAHAVNNTGKNARDTEVAAVTPADQKENASDLQITQKIRQAVMADDSLSFTAKNAKIVTQDGHVTLRGPVKTAAERSTLAAHASRVAGGHVDNQLDIEQ
jgi:hyperosmotically inducible protein